MCIRDSIPLSVVVAVRMGIAPSQLLMPLAFAAHAGSMLALTGTPVNIIVSEAAADAGARPFTFFEFGLVGVPLVIGTIAITALLGPKLLPVRAANVMTLDVKTLTRVPVSYTHLDVYKRQASVFFTSTVLPLRAVSTSPSL